MSSVNLDSVRTYFESCIATHGSVPRGVDWNSDTAQNIRFDQVLKIARPGQAFSLLDYGCGYGALADYAEQLGLTIEYVGFDIVEAMVDAARSHHSGKSGRTFVSNVQALPAVDYVVASGTFNMRGAASFEAWTEYVVDSLEQFNRLSRKGFASNFLTKYSDEDRKREDLYYADPSFLFDYCKRHFSKNVALLHDYALYDFTILVRKDA